MARQINKLTAIAVKNLTAKGVYPDGNGLALRVSKSGSKSWIFRYMLHNKAREQGLGSVSVVTLAEARELALYSRKLLAQGIDPIGEKTKLTQAAKITSKRHTFRYCGLKYVDIHKSAWKNAKHIQQWENTLQTYVYPLIGEKDIGDLEVADILNVMQQKHSRFTGSTLWDARQETAQRIRGRIDAIINWAISHGYRKGDNPARWEGHLENLLPQNARQRTVKHQASLPYSQIGNFFEKLEKLTGMAALALQFCILTATRTNETLGAKWSEFDLEEKMWVIPAIRTKVLKDHRVPLSDKAINILNLIRDSNTGDVDNEPISWVFPGRTKSAKLSNMSMLMIVRRMKYGKFTVHGFRSTFRDWAAEKTQVPREVAEAALAHEFGSQVERAYRRTDLFQKRRDLMQDWATFCYEPTR